MTITQQYVRYQNGSISKREFLTEAINLHPNIVNNWDTFESCVNILKNRGLIFEQDENWKFNRKLDELNISPSVFEEGVLLELKCAGYDTEEHIPNEVTQKYKNIVLKNLCDNHSYYKENLEEYMSKAYNNLSDKLGSNDVNMLKEGLNLAKQYVKEVYPNLKENEIVTCLSKISKDCRTKLYAICNKDELINEFSKKLNSYNQEKNDLILDYFTNTSELITNTQNSTDLPQSAKSQLKSMLFSLFESNVQQLENIKEVLTEYEYDRNPGNVDALRADIMELYQRIKF